MALKYREEPTGQWTGAPDGERAARLTSPFRFQSSDFGFAFVDGTDVERFLVRLARASASHRSVRAPELVEPAGDCRGQNDELTVL
jgi:hypothetical protein